MASRASLAGLPVEMAEKVVIELDDFGDTCNLRLTARELAAKVSQGSFKSCFVKKTIHLSDEDLRAFDVVTQHGWMGCALQHLTIVGERSIGASGEQASNPGISELLQNALKNLRENSGHGCLRSLTLDLAERNKGDRPADADEEEYWRSIWDTASNTAFTVAAAVKSVSIAVEAFNLFGETALCALDTRRLLQVLDMLNKDQLKSLSLVLSASEPRQTGGPGPNLSQHVCRFLELTGLEHLELRWFNTCEAAYSGEKLEQRRFFDQVAKLSMPSLVKVALKGMRTSENILIAFLTRNPHLRSLTLENVHLENGKFGRIFTQIQDHLQLDSLDLSNLHESRLVHFTGRDIGKPKLAGPGPIQLKRTGAEIRKAIPYKLGRRRTVDSPEANRWFLDCVRFYGPPGVSLRISARIKPRTR